VLEARMSGKRCRGQGANMVSPITLDALYIYIYIFEQFSPFSSSLILPLAILSPDY
jgi:hypothetical protein